MKNALQLVLSNIFSRSVRALGLLLLLGTTGCANFSAASRFADHTSQVTRLVRTELVQLDELCTAQAELTIVVNQINDEGPLRSCQAFQLSQGRLAETTLDVLDDYADALNALADGRPFDLVAEPDKVRARVGGLKDRQGQALSSAREVSALLRLVEVLASVQAQSNRQEAVRRLAGEQPNLDVAGRIVRAYFVPDPAAAHAGSGVAPYGDIVGLTMESLVSTERLLGHPSFLKAEPIRTVELLRATRARKAALQARQGNEPDQMPAALVAALDAWLAALHAFAAHAFDPDAGELVAQLKRVGQRAQTAKRALQAAGP